MSSVRLFQGRFWIRGGVCQRELVSTDKIKDIGRRSRNIYKVYVDEDLQAYRDET